MADVVVGLQSLLDDMAGLPLTMRRTLIVRALRKAAGPIEKRIAELAPDDPETPGSQIRENIAINVTDQTADGAVAFIGPTKSGFIGGFAELGTAHQPARPFIAPGFEGTKGEAMALLETTLGSGIEKALKK